MRIAGAVIILWLAAGPLWAQGNGKLEQRQLLEQILVQTYQPSDVGKKLMGVGADTDVKRPGIIVVMQREGMWGSLLRSEIASWSIHGLDAELYRGHKDYAVPVGERFYVISIHVGEYTVDFGMLSARAVTSGKTTARVWSVLTFYFTPQIIANADKTTVFGEIDQWFIPEGRSGAVASPVAVSSVAPRTVSAAPVAATVEAGPTAVTAPALNAKATLQLGMSRDEVVAALGKPAREVTFETRTWMNYPGLVVVLADGKLSAAEQATATARITFRSEPGGAEIFIDGRLTGTAPSTLEVPAGSHELSMRAAGRQEWVREVWVLAGSETHFEAKLEQK